MNYILIKWILYVLIFVILISVCYWFMVYNQGLPKTYNDLMKFIIRNKAIFEMNDFYTAAESDFENRKIPEFDPIDFSCFIQNSTFLDIKQQMFVTSIYRKLMTEYYATLRNQEPKNKNIAFMKNFRVKPYIAIPHNFKMLIILIVGVTISLLILVEPFAYEQLMQEYKAKGIESLEDRHVIESRSVDVSAEIIDRFYRSRFLGGGYYKIKIKIESPLKETIDLEVDPVLYQSKKIGDSLLVTIQFTRKADKLENTESIIIDHISIKE